MTTIGDEATACPTCGILPVNGVISHRHDCPFHQRRVRHELEKERRRIDRGRKISHLKREAGIATAVIAIVIVVSILMILGINALEGR